MIVVVDTNILFSACIAKEKQSRISEILFSPISHLERITSSYALAELTIHHEKLLKASKLPADELARESHRQWLKEKPPGTFNVLEKQ